MMSMKTIRNSVCIAWCGFAIAACSGSNIQDDFDCPVNQSGACFSVAEADKRALDTITGSGSFEASIGRLTAFTHAATMENTLRIPEKTAIIWVAPFVDAEGNLHESHNIHIVIKPGEWAAEYLR